MKFSCLLLFWLLMLSTHALAVEKTNSTAPTGPIEVTAQQMEADQQGGWVLFKGKVVAKRADMTVYAEHLTLFFVKGDTGHKLEHIMAEGAVRVVNGDQIATAQKLIYVQASEKMTLIGQAKIHQSENTVSGDEIVLFIRENRSLVKSGKDGRVRAVFLPKQEKP